MCPTYTGVTFLPFYQSGAQQSAATDVSSNAATIVGWSEDHTANINILIPGYWLASNSYATFTALPFSGLDNSGFATCCSQNGTIIGGHCEDFGGAGNLRPYVWTNGVAAQPFSFLAGGNEAFVNDCNDAGTLFVGTSNHSSGGVQVPVTFSGATVTALPLHSGDTSGNAVACNSDGTVIVGVTGSTPCKWVNGVLTLLPTLGGGSSDTANDVNADGTVIVGQSQDVNGDGTFHAVTWTGTNSQTITDISNGKHPTVAGGVSSDGHVIAGSDSSFPNNYPVEWCGGVETQLALGGSISNPNNIYRFSQDGSHIVSSQNGGPGGTPGVQQACFWHT